MCGRYTLANKKKIKEKFNLNIHPNYNITPQSEVLILNEETKPILMIWSYSPPWSKQPMNIINARSETLLEKQSFINTSRCIFVADGWYEWQRIKNKKIPYYYHRKNYLVYFAGIYNKTNGCAIVTREAHSNINFIHHRQPVLLEERDFEKWISGENIFSSKSTKNIECYPVDTKVNNPRNKSIENIFFIK